MLRFSAKPGMWERQLQRKYENPRLFPTGPALVPATVDAARQRDARECQAFREDFKQLCADMAALQGAIESEKILQLKERIDKLYLECMAQATAMDGGSTGNAGAISSETAMDGGSTGNAGAISSATARDGGSTGARSVEANAGAISEDMAAEKNALRKLHDVVVATLVQAAASDPLARDEISQEQAAHQLHQELLEYPLVAQLLRADSPIAAGELVATLLTETGTSFPGVLSLFDAQQLQELCQGARSLLAAAAGPGVDLSSAQACLEVMEGAAHAMTGERILQ